MIDATFINLSDNVPFRRLYKSVGALNSALARMKGKARLDHYIDFNKMAVVRH